jgi:hypothetical protein
MTNQGGGVRGSNGLRVQCTGAARSWAPDVGRRWEERLLERRTGVGVEGSDGVEAKLGALKRAAGGSGGEQQMPGGESPRMAFSFGQERAASPQDQEQEWVPRQLDHPGFLE